MALLVALSAATVGAATIEQEFTIEPVFDQSLEFDSSAFVTRNFSTYEVVLPDSVTVSPGDTLRTTIKFPEGKFLELLPRLENGDSSYSISVWHTKHPDNHIRGRVSRTTGETVVNTVFDRHGRQAAQETQDRFLALAELNEPTVRSTGNSFAQQFDAGQPVTTESIGSLVFEVVIPTTVNAFPDAFAFPETTFSATVIELEFLNSALGDRPVPPAVALVPEPSTVAVLLFGLSVASMRRGPQAR